MKSKNRKKKLSKENSTKSIAYGSDRAKQTTKGTLLATVEFESPGKSPIVATTRFAATFPYAMTQEILDLAVGVAIDLCTATFRPTQYTFSNGTEWISYRRLPKKSRKSSATSPTQTS